MENVLNLLWVKHRKIRKAIYGDKEAFAHVIKEHKEYLYKTAFI